MAMPMPGIAYQNIPNNVLIRWTLIERPQLGGQAECHFGVTTGA